MRSTQQHGFTLIELLVVIAIIGILTSVMLPRVNTAREKAQIARAQMELSSLRAAMTSLQDATGLYPNGATSLCRTNPGVNNEVDLSSDNAGLLANGQSWSGWDGPYLSDATDPWGGAYYLDEDYQCLAETKGCQGIIDTGNDSSVIVSCGPNQTVENGSCAYDADNVVIRLCDTS